MEIGIVKPVLIEEEMKGSYLDYAMSVITARALPDVRDGLKPVQRRILYSMDELGLRHTASYKKSARIVGEVMGKYHPHGDAPVYESMVRLAQDFSMRYTLVDGQGNFGSVDGDPAAAMRYTEARLDAIAEEMLADIDKNTVDFAPNFDDTLKEPRVLPSKMPNLLVNGSSGIAVGMATNIPPHNLSEVVDAITYLIGRFADALDAGVPFPIVWARAFGAPADLDLAAKALPNLRPPIRDRVATAAAKLARRPDGDQRSQALVDILDDLIDVPPDKLMEMVKGPDFPTAGTILGSEGIKNAYATGHGRITIRARAHTEDMRGGRTQIVVTELPFQVNKAALLEKIADLVRERRVEGIADMRDESDRQGMRVVIELRREAQPRQILNQLYKYTSMQTAFSVNLLALVDGQPRVLTLKMVLLHYLSHRREVITRRTEFDLQRARQRAHILEGLKIALEHLDEVIVTIRRSKDAETARTALMKGFKLTEIQAQAILDMQLRRLAALERQKILAEYAETLKLIARLEDLLAHPAKILYLIRDELLELKSKYGDERRTRIATEESVDFTEEDLVPDQEVLVGVTAKGYVRRLLADSYRLQRRGAKGIIGTLSKEDDPALLLALASTRDSLLLFSNRGRAYQVKVNDLPDAARQARGLPVSNFISLEEQERVVAMLPLGKLEAHHVVLATGRGEVKRVAATEYSSARSAGIIGIAVPEGDELHGAVATSGRQEVILVTAKGQAIRFAEGELRPSGRNSGGVRGIRLDDNDRVVALDVARAGGQLVVVTRRGFAKRTPLTEYSAQGRGGGGIRAANVSIKNGDLVAGCVAGDADELVLVTGTGTVLRSQVAAVPEAGRATLGSVILSLEHDDKVVAAALIAAKEKTPSGGKHSSSPDGSPQASNGSPLPGEGIEPPSAGRGPAKRSKSGAGPNDGKPGAQRAAAPAKKGEPARAGKTTSPAPPAAAAKGKAAQEPGKPRPSSATQKGAATSAGAPARTPTTAAPAKAMGGWRPVPGAVAPPAEPAEPAKQDATKSAGKVGEGKTAAEKKATAPNVAAPAGKTGASSTLAGAIATTLTRTVKEASVKTAVKGKVTSGASSAGTAARGAKGAAKQSAPAKSGQPASAQGKEAPAGGSTKTPKGGRGAGPKQANLPL